MNACVHQPRVAYKAHQGNDRLLFGSIMGVVAFWLFAQTTFNMAPDMRRDLGLDASTMNVAVVVTSLFPGTFIVVTGGLVGCGTVKPAGGPGGAGLGHLQNGFVARCRLRRGGLRRLFSALSGDSASMDWRTGRISSPLPDFIQVDSPPLEFP